MAINLENRDLEYQPKTDKFSYIDTASKKKFRIKVFAMFITIFILASLFLGSILALNYFRIINLSSISPVFDSLPRSPYELNDLIQNYKEQQSAQDVQSLGDNIFSTEGKIVDFGENNIKVKLNSGRVLDLELSSDTDIRKASKNGHSIFMFTSDLLQKENVGKNVTVQFTKTKGASILGSKNILKSIEVNR